MNPESSSGTERFAYLDFEVVIGQGEGFDYPIQVIRSPAGEASEVMHFPFDEVALQNRLLNLQNALLLSGGKRRQAINREEQIVQEFGRDLFNTLFTGEIRTRFDVSRERAFNQDKGLRLKLTVQSPKMAAIPWEFLFDPRQSEYVCLSGDTPFVRYLPTSQSIRPLTVNFPLRILGMIANPRDLTDLSIDDEKSRVESALKGLESQGLIKLTWVEGQTARDLQRAMRSGDWHVFHFIGHGGFDPRIDEGLIAFSDANGYSHMLRATDLARLISDNRSLRLVILNSCEGAQGGEVDIFSSSASILLRRGIPAVLAMQYMITDRAAIEFSTAFYEALADGLPVDAAVNEARKSISLYVTNSLEWGVPVLFMRSPDGVLFRVEKPSHPEPAKPPIEPKQGFSKPRSAYSDTEKPSPAGEEKLPKKSEKVVDTQPPLHETSSAAAYSKEVFPPSNYTPKASSTAQNRSATVSKVIGIDFGTTNSEVAVMEAGEPVVIPSAEGERLVPSVVAISKDHKRLCGRAARYQAVVNPENTIFSIKRLMGRKYSDPEMQKLIQRVPYKVTQASNGDINVILDGKEYSPPEIAAMIMAKLKADAEAYIGRSVTEAVISVPAYFNDMQRNAIRHAGKIAGLEVLRIVNAPTAAAMSYGFDNKADERIVVYHFGGGTFDVSILDVGDGVIEVLSTSGDTFLGGDDFDLRIINYIADEFKRDENIDLRKDRQALQRLSEAAEKAKIELSSLSQTEINLPYITADISGPKHLVMTLTRDQLVKLTKDLVERTLPPVQQALKDAGLQPSQVNGVILSGGMTRMPAVQEAVRRLFSKGSHKGINPDEVVATGTAIMAGVLGGDVKDILFIDVTPLSLSVETLGGVATAIIARNSSIPTRKSMIFSTAADGQTQVELHIVQGERPMAADNQSLGKFILDGIPPAPRGIPQIEVTFDIDVNGILNVVAQDKATGCSQNVTFAASSGLTGVDVDRMHREAASHAEEDRHRKELIEACNTADNAIYTALKMLQDLGGKVPDAFKKRVEQQISETQHEMNRNNLDGIRLTTQELQKIIQEIGKTS